MLTTRKMENSSSSSIPASSPASYTPPSPSVSSYDRPKEDNHSIVGQHLTMRGDLESDGDVLVKGKVIGNIKYKMLIIDVNAVVDGGVDAEEVIVRGNAKGSIISNRVRLEKTAVVDSEIEHTTFSAEEGAKIKGSLKFREESAPRSKVSLVA